MGQMGTIHRISGIEEIKQMPSFVALDEVHTAGYHYQADRTVDKPVISVYLAVKTLEQLAADVNYMNSIIHVVDSSGKSLLKEPFNPDLLLQ